MKSKENNCRIRQSTCPVGSMMCIRSTFVVSLCIMPRCEARYTVCVCVCVCVCVRVCVCVCRLLYSCSRINEVQVRVSIASSHVFLDFYSWIYEIILRSRVLLT